MEENIPFWGFAVIIWQITFTMLDESSSGIGEGVDSGDKCVAVTVRIIFRLKGFSLF